MLVETYRISVLSSWSNRPPGSIHPQGWVLIEVGVGRRGRTAVRPNKGVFTTRGGVWEPIVPPPLLGSPLLCEGNRDARPQGSLHAQADKGTSAFALTPSHSSAGWARGVGAHGSAPYTPRPPRENKRVGFFWGRVNLPLKSTKKTYPHTNQHNNHQHQAPLSAVHNHHKHSKPTHNTPTHDQHHTHTLRTTRRRTPNTPTNHNPPHTGGARSPNPSTPTNPPNAHHSPRA